MSANLLANQQLTNQELAGQLLSPGANLDAYLQTVSSIPLLTVEREQLLARRYRDHEDLDAARELVLGNLRFVAHLARSFQGYGLAQGDLIQEGNVGLMKAVKRFDPDVGVRLVSFAVHWIKAEIHEFVLRNWRIVKVATTKAQRKLFFNLRGNKQRLAWLTKEETEKVAADLGVPAQEVTRMEGRLASSDMAFDGYATDDDESAGAPAQFLPQDELNPEQVLERDEWEARSGAQLKAGLNTLDERSRDILQRRWLTDAKATLEELGAEYGISAERIRQLEKNALKKLKQQLGATLVA